MNTLFSSLQLPYTDTRYLSFDLPKDCYARIFEPQPSEITEGPEQLIQKALDSPLGTNRLEDIVKTGDKVLIVCDDLTRPTPTKIIIHSILQRLSLAKVPDNDIEILFALGTHRPMTRDEMISKVGEQIYKRIVCHNHNCFDERELSFFGHSDEGIPVWLNKRLKEASFIIGVGDIVPHPIAGFSGGAKILYPGVAGEKTIAGFHVSFGLDPLNHYGSLTAPARVSINHLAEVAGLNFLINTVLGHNSQMVAALAGDYRAVYERGVEISREVYGVPTGGLYKAVVVSSYPAWIELWQGAKGIYAGATLASPGGEIILASACPEGPARTHPDFATCIGLPPKQVAAGLSKGDFKDAIGAAIAVKVSRLRERYQISLVSDGLSQEEVELMGFHRYTSIEEALDGAFSRSGPQKEIGVIPYGGHTYCYLT